MKSKCLACRQWDKLGILCSGACAVHCILATVLTVFSPFLANYFESEWIHISFLVILVPTAITAFYQGWRRHQRQFPVCLGSVGITLVGLSVLLEVWFSIGRYEIVITTIGGAFLISAHIFNIHFSKFANCQFPSMAVNISELER